MLFAFLANMIGGGWFLFRLQHFVLFAERGTL